MNLWGKAVISGIAIEGILFVLSLAIGWGPCGPGSSGGWIIMALHYPAMMIMDWVSKLNPPDLIGTALFLTLSASQWILVVYALQRWRASR